MTSAPQSCHLRSLRATCGHMPVQASLEHYQNNAYKACWRQDPTAIGNREAPELVLSCLHCSCRPPPCKHDITSTVSDMLLHNHTESSTLPCQHSTSPAQRNQQCLQAQVTSKHQPELYNAHQHTAYFCILQQLPQHICWLTCCPQHLMHNSQQAKAWQTSSLGQYS